MSVDNTLMMEIYPFGGLLAYLKFHFIDGINKQGIMLLDKTRVDYNSSKSEGKGKFKQKSHSKEELSPILARFGIGKKKSNEERAEEIRKQLEK